MKLIDRYLLRSFLVPLVYCLAAFTIVIIIHNLFDNLSDFLDAKTAFKDVVFFYLLILPSFMVLIVPISLLLAVLYSLLQLTKNNELTAMRASGVSLYRLMTPFIAVGFIATLLLSLIHETVAPAWGYAAKQFLEEQKHSETIYMVTDVPYYNSIDHRNWWIGEFNTKTYEMKNIRITQEREAGSAQTTMLAARGQWLDGAWWLSEVSVQEYNEEGSPTKQFDADGLPIGIIREEREMQLHGYSETPTDFVNVTKDPEYLSSRELISFIRALKQSSDDAIARVRVDLHHRLALPWMAFIVTLLGIPFGSQTARKGALTGIILSISLFFGFYFLINIGLWMGKELIIPAWLAAWFPNLLFLSVGCVMVYRMR